MSNPTEQYMEAHDKAHHLTVDVKIELRNHMGNISPDYTNYGHVGDIN